jgi:heme exporter protein A
MPRLTRLAARDLACVKGERRLFDRLTFEVAAGAALLVTGPNGAGKTSLIRILAGLSRAASGSTVLETADPEQMPRELTHFLGAQDGLKSALTALEHVRLWQDLNGRTPERPAEEMLAEARLGPVAEIYAGDLSSGQRRRLAFLRLLAMPRPLWLLDEPLNALDAAGREQLTGWVEAHLAAGGIAVIATHFPMELAGAAMLRFSADGSHVVEEAGA